MNDAGRKDNAWTTHSRHTIDDCPHDFRALADRELPRMMRRLRDAMDHPVALDGLDAKGVSRGNLLTRMRDAWPGLAAGGDFEGCCVFLSPEKAPFYVGISRKVAGRVIQHIKGKTHFSASLPFRMARAEYDPPGGRAAAMKDAKFVQTFKKKQAYLRRRCIAAIKITNALERYVFEAYASMALNTCRWNTFQTH